MSKRHKLVFSFIKNKLKRFIISNKDISPFNFMQEIAKELVFTRFEDFSRYHAPDNLYLKRFGIETIEETIRRAKERFRDAQFYYITDFLEFRKDGIKNVDTIEDAKDDDNIKVFICAFESDDRLLTTLYKIKDLKNSYYFLPTMVSPPARYFHRNDIAKKVLQEEEKRNTHMGFFDLADYENLLQAIEITKSLEGDYVEIGVYKGRSAHVALNYIKERNVQRKCYFFDTFEGFTYAEASKSSDSSWLGTHTDVSIERVKNLLGSFTNKEVIKLNIITDDLPNHIKKIAVCNIDVDMHEAVLKGLEKAAPLVVKGGVVIVEDQGHTPRLGGAYMALVDFLKSDMAKKFVPIHMGSGQAFLIKIG